MRILDIFPLTEVRKSTKAPTIASATGKNGQINRKTADRILDPKGYFRPKWKAVTGRS
jgi:hypothetical protein